MNKTKIFWVIGLIVVVASGGVIIYKWLPKHLQPQISTFKSGELVVNPQFDDAGPFSEGLALVKVGNEYGYVDEAGKYVINPQFDAAWPYPRFIPEKIGNAFVLYDKTERKYYYRDISFKDIYPFSEELAPVKVGDKWGYIHK